MKIAIDASDLTNDPAGIGYLARGIIEGLSEFPEHEYLIYLRQETSLVLPKNFTAVVIPNASKLIGGGMYRNWHIARDAKRRSVDWLIMPTLSVLPLFFRDTLFVISDLTPITSPKFYTKFFAFKFKPFLSLTLKRAKAFASISEFTKREVYRLFPWFQKEITVIPLGLNEWVSKPVSADQIQQTRLKYSLPENYFYSLSTLQPRKNYENMIRAFAIFHETHPDFQYIIGGKPGWYFEKIFKLVKELGLERSVRFLGYVPEQDMKVLYGQAKALLYVSFEEGFGLPVIESVACGTPVVASDLPVFHELMTEEQGVFVEPTNVNDIATGLVQILAKAKPLQSEGFQEHFSWENTAKELLKICR